MSDEAKKRRFPLVAIVVASLALVGGIVVFTLTRNDESAPSRTAGDLVKLEVRAKPVAEIRMNGRRVGSTPLTLNVKPGSEPLTFDATFTVQKINPATRAEKIEHWEQVKTVVPDAPQSIDFALDDAHQVATEIEKPQPR